MKKNGLIYENGRFVICRYLICRYLVLLVLFFGLGFGFGLDLSADTGELSIVMDGVGLYCRKLNREAYHFMCRERIGEVCEKSYDFPHDRRGLKDFFEKNQVNRPIEEADSKTRNSQLIDQMRKRRRDANYRVKKYVKRMTLVNEYRIIKGPRGIEEQRVPVKCNGKKVTGAAPVLQSIIYSYRNSLFPVLLFSEANRARYRYILSGRKRVLKRWAYVIDVRLRDVKGDVKGDVDRAAVAWVDCEDYSVLKIRVYPGAFRGYAYLLKGGVPGKYDVKVNDTHYFGHVTNGLRFPSKTEIFLSYKEEPRMGIDTVKHGGIILPTISTVYRYDDYVFFRVKSVDPVFKEVKKE